MNLVPKKELEHSDNGSYFIPHSTLIKMSTGDEHVAKVALDWMIRENPNFEFSTLYDPAANGMTIFWNRKP